MRVVIEMPDKSTIKLRMKPKHTIGLLIARLRQYVDMKPEEALFLFTPSGVSYPIPTLLCTLSQPIKFILMKEASFGSGWRFM